MAKTIEQKLTTLINSKAKISAAIAEKGVEISSSTPFSEYGELIKLIGEMPETSNMQDVLMMVDLVEDLGVRPYNEHTYTDEDIQKLTDLVNFIVEGV